jgi:hypothetical protein
MQAHTAIDAMALALISRGECDELIAALDACAATLPADDAALAKIAAHYFRDACQARAKLRERLADRISGQGKLGLSET